MKPPRSALPFALLLPALLLPLAACDSAAAEDATFDEEAAIARAVAFDQGGFTKVNASEITSTQHATNHVNVWVSDDALAIYRGIDPSDGASRATFPPGAAIVKQHLNPSGAPDGLTAMVKGPAGYDDSTGDWWFARIENSGVASFKGAVDFCMACHGPRRNTTDWIFGVATDNRAQ